MCAATESRLCRMKVDDMDKVTAFQRAVYAAVRLIPRGRVTTYGKLVSVIGRGSARSVGQALRRNPFAPEVPCHRVIRGDLTPGGFAGQTEGPNLSRKLRLLEQEGVTFRDGKLEDPGRLL